NRYDQRLRGEGDRRHSTERDGDDFGGKNEVRPYGALDLRLLGRRLSGRPCHPWRQALARVGSSCRIHGCHRLDGRCLQLRRIEVGTIMAMKEGMHNLLDTLVA